MRRVMVVDDSASQREILTALLGSWGYEVVSAATGAEALARCDDVDLVLSDWIMPGMNGLALCRELRRRTGGRYVYFILLTVKDDSSAVVRGLGTGADDLLMKPVNPSELRARISAGERVLRIERELSRKNRVLVSALDELRAMNAALDCDLREARQLQESLLPARQLRFGALGVSLMMQPAGHVGGDLVGQMPAPDGRWGLFALDVSGHGMAPALLTARLAGILGASPSDERATSPGGEAGRDPADIAAGLNRLLLTDEANGYYLTLLLAFADGQTGEIDMLQAGQPHPLVRRADGQIERLGGGGMPVGLFPEPSFSRTTLQLDPGERLLIVSDGVTECAAPCGEMLGEAGLRRFLDDTARLTGAGVLDALKERLVARAGPDGLCDDISAILIDRDPA